MTGRALRVLLISPVFHGYWRSMAGALTQLGYEVLTHRYDEQLGLRDRVQTKALEASERLGGDPGPAITRRFDERAIAAVRASHPDRVLVVKGDRFGAHFWDALQGRPTVVWLYDELDRMHYDLSALRRVTGLASYSPGDVRVLAGHGIESVFVPGAFDPDLPVGPADGSMRHTDEIVFVGARYPGRERTLTGLARAGVPVRAYGRDWSGHPLDRLRTWRLRSPAVPAARDVPVGAGLHLIARAPAALNLHENQDGFTLRTFEIPGVGGLAVNDRADVELFYEPGHECVVATDHTELVEVCRRALRERAWAEAIGAAGRRRTLAEHTYLHRVRRLVGLWDG